MRQTKPGIVPLGKSEQKQIPHRGTERGAPHQPYLQSQRGHGQNNEITRHQRTARTTGRSDHGSQQYEITRGRGIFQRRRKYAHSQTVKNVPKATNLPAECSRNIAS